MNARDIRLVAFDETYLDLSWAWLNDPEIKAMTLTPDFTREDQQAFYASLPDRDDYHIWGVETRDGTPIGAAGLKHVFGDTAEVWCYIGDRAYWGAGVGPQIIDACEEQAKALCVSELIAHAETSNARSQSAFRKAGFKQVAGAELGLVRLKKSFAT